MPERTTATLRRQGPNPTGRKAVITCDLEGRILTYGKDAPEIFGYRAEEVVGRARVSIFSPGDVVLGQVNRWLATAREQGLFEGRTVFLRKDGSPFAADIRITPTRKAGRHVGYCGVTVARPDVEPTDAMPRRPWWIALTRWVVILRAPFLTASIVPILIGAGLARHGAPPTEAFPWGLFGLALVGGVALHVAANAFNDYFDWTSGTDRANNDYFLPFSGGSRAIELGLISAGGLWRVALTALVVAAVCGGAILLLRGPLVLVFGLLGAFSAYFYTAPPLRLVARRGWGELLVGLNFGPLMVAGTAWVVGGRPAPEAFLAGLPIGLLTTAILWINEFPDAPSDAVTGKNHLVVVLGRKRARWGYLALMVAAFGGQTAAVAWGLLPPGALAFWLAAPLALFATLHLWRHWESRALIKANAATIATHLVAGLATVAGLWWG